MTSVWLSALHRLSSVILCSYERYKKYTLWSVCRLSGVFFVALKVMTPLLLKTQYWVPRVRHAPPSEHTRQTRARQTIPREWGGGRLALRGVVCTVAARRKNDRCLCWRKDANTMLRQRCVSVFSQQFHKIWCYKTVHHAVRGFHSFDILMSKNHKLRCACLWFMSLSHATIDTAQFI